MSAQEKKRFISRNSTNNSFVRVLSSLNCILRWASQFRMLWPFSLSQTSIPTPPTSRWREWLWCAIRPQPLWSSTWRVSQTEHMTLGFHRLGFFFMCARIHPSLNAQGNKGQKRSGFFFFCSVLGYTWAWTHKETHRGSIFTVMNSDHPHICVHM